MTWIQTGEDAVRALLRERAHAKREGLHTHERAMQAAIAVLRRQMPPEHRLNRRASDADDDCSGLHRGSAGQDQAT